MKTIILCGGKGTRLGVMGDHIPKALIPLAGKPCLQHIVEGYLAKGHREFVLCVGYLGDRIVDFCTKHLPQAAFEWDDAGADASMLERLHRVRHLMGERAWVAYGDTLVDVRLPDMLAEHLASKAALTLTVAQVRSPFGLLETDHDHWLLSFREKPVLPYFVGHLLLERTVLDHVDEDLLRAPDGEGLVTLIQRLVAARRVRAHPYAGPQITFNTQRDVDQAELEMVSFFTQTERKPL
ncbi:MAG: sugar phosphate nucleotidyltransferase [Acidobacteriota bacterium]